MPCKVFNLEEERCKRRGREETCEVYRREKLWWCPNDGKSFIEPTPENAEEIIYLMICGGKVGVGDIVRVRNFLYMVLSVAPDGHFEYCEFEMAGFEGTWPPEPGYES